MNLLAMVDEKDWDFLTAKIEKAVERVLIQHGVIKIKDEVVKAGSQNQLTAFSVQPCNRQVILKGNRSSYCNLPDKHSGDCQSVNK